MTAARPVNDVERLEAERLRPAVTRDELEATVRQQITRVVTNALQAGVPSTGIMNRATETILTAAQAYALAEYGITADRRAELELAVKLSEGRHP